MRTSFNVVEHFLKSAERYPDQLALVEGKTKITYHQLALEVKKMAAYYQSKGIEPGDRVLVFIPMSIDLYRSVLALFHLGATAVFLDEWVDKKRMEYCCQLSNCKGFIGTWKVRVLASFSKPIWNVPVWMNPSGYKHHAPMASMVPTHPKDAALITFTTGSTGKPKAAKRSHEFLDAQFKALCDKIRPKPNDIALPVLPIVLLCNLGVGATSVISDFPARKPDKFKPAKTAQLIEKLGVNRITSSPFFVKKLAEYCLRKQLTIPSLRQIFTGGAAVFPKEGALYLKAFPDAAIEIVYGSTEAEPIASISAHSLIKEKNKAEGLLVGNIYHKTQLKIIQVTDQALSFTNKSSFHQMELPAGAIGEIIVSGEHVLSEYLHSPEAWKRNKIVVGDTLWHRTGDSGYLDKNGNLHLCGRCKQLIEKPSGGYWAPFVIEGLLQQLEDIHIGTLIKLGKGVLIVAEAKSQASIQSVRKQLQNILPKSLQEILIVKSIPRDPRHHSKIDYTRLKELLQPMTLKAPSRINLDT